MEVDRGEVDVGFQAGLAASCSRACTTTQCQCAGKWTRVTGRRRRGPALPAALDRCSAKRPLLDVSGHDRYEIL